MKAWITAHRPLVAGAAVLVLGGVVVLIFALLRPAPEPPVAAPPSTSAARTTTTSTTTPTNAPPATTAPTTTRTTTVPPGSPFPESLRGQDVSRLPTDRKVVALTFDAGANAAGLPSILRTLADQRVHATFFLTGDFAQADPGHVQAILAAGHRVGNHSMTHPYLTRLPDNEIAGELTKAEQVLLRTGADPRPLFRFPYGDRDARTIAAVNARGYVAVRWTVDTLGWQGTAAGGSARRVVDRTIEALQPGEIVLMHIGSHPDDRSTLDADALPDVIAAARARGYEFVTLDALLGDGPAG
ncbi:polysaccharide deacetylase family protein [Lentzea aerocolonigenes]|uniref:polysaccharide deacetylase family protein n=1 Tax=Lentzea aerocolonigenes TaxID=68170 RepID=UPI0007C5A94E|nr:polysaccharide deacetylase family protein [Lentzea aerocolonigenes]MCP2247289.1 Peptidoglycan/xylan/chitin deacetylase, PgdA/CDA1 family [Lentzea aerocolonigenes]